MRVLNPRGFHSPEDDDGAKCRLLSVQVAVVERSGQTAVNHWHNASTESLGYKLQAIKYSTTVVVLL